MPDHTDAMTPQDLLDHMDQGRLWLAPLSQQPGFDLDAAYRLSLAVRDLRIARGERPCGYKVGFTNRTIWPRYNVFAPIWGPVWDTTLIYCEDVGRVSLAHTSQPRIEPETVFGMKARPAPGATVDALFDAIDWVAPGFEVVQSHLRDWKFQPTDTVADGALHARLLVGRRMPVRELAPDAHTLSTLLAGATATLSKGDVVVDQGEGANVLDSPLRALLHFTETLRACPGAPDLEAGDVVTTGTWTDAWPVQPGERWTARFGLRGFELTADFTE